MVKFLVIILFLFSCVSDKGIQEEYPSVIVDPKTGRRYTRSNEAKHKDRQLIEISKKGIKGKIIHKETHWIKPGFNPTILSHLNMKELIGQRRLTNHDSTLLKELSFRGKKAIPYLIYYLDSQKVAELTNNLSNLKWYENKKEFEPVSQALYAAYLLQGLTDEKPQDIEIKIKRKHLILYAVNGKFAVKKTSVVKAWKMWWVDVKSQY